MYPKHALRLCAASSRISQSGVPARLPSAHVLNPVSISATTRTKRQAYSAISGDASPLTFTLSNRLAGRSCMITGGTSGIGFAIAERFLQEGIDQVILVGRSYERLVKAASKLESPSSPSEAPNLSLTAAPEHELIRSSHRISLLVGDVSNAGTWTRELEKAIQTTNPTHLINAAGLSISSILPKSEPADISRILDTNLQGAILTTRAFLRATIRNHMKQKQKQQQRPSSSPDSTAEPNHQHQHQLQPPTSKSIINVASLLAHKGGTGAVAYAASKAGLLGLTRSVAVETAASMRGVLVRSNAIVPGYVETPMIADFSEGETTRLKQSIPLGRFGLPREVADAAVFLALNEYANNCVLNLDGGLSAV
ncbi:SDR family NAD(P)-dependent oxidoreductase [Aspergillus homomorphus CBS 101889]|uniref:NAD(P)-binding protein n=1 Tax=Aspergillus homomorphus (strain CBS 101889) TaxID=1450537 RepID=A0A395I6H2_ASPHC|nr:NAD(P)-binding protein [Aspergillus homomorphus CBS 101889]RAL15740.1 NAD(P)-binding protein [Aspergillus homomorphus CBS 101889]